MSIDPVQSTKQKLLDMFSSSRNPDRVTIAIALFHRWIRTIKVQEIGGVFLCSYYTNTSNWCVWQSEYDPRRTGIVASGKLF